MVIRPTVVVVQHGGPGHGRKTVMHAEVVACDLGLPSMTIERMTWEGDYLRCEARLLVAGVVE